MLDMYAPQYSEFLWQALLSLTIPIKFDVLHVLHDGIGDDIPFK